jgi:hypothetical protein
LKNEEIELVIARLKTMPEHIEVHMGNKEGYDRDKLISEIKKGSTLGKEIVKAEMEYLKSLKNL